jgi:GTP pyrophosphokinase
VAFLVEGLTKISRIEFSSARARQAENFRKMLVAMSEDIRILLIKLADRLHNMRTLQFMAEDKARRIAQETLDIYAPLAHRLGIHGMKQELEEHAFRTLHAETAKELERKLRGSRKAREKYIEEVIGVLSAKLAGAELRAEVTGRQKDLASIYAKMQKQGVGVDEMYDVIAFRIVLDGSVDAVYTALGIIHGTWRPVPGRFKDYVALPKPNGYRTLHTTVIGPYGERMEIQIRTVEMHRAAELGIAAHWKYKEGVADAKSSDENKFAWLRQLVEWHQELSDPHEFIDTIKVDLFPDEVFVFTPQGDVINLPQGATPVDFAYAIHTEVGEHCSGAKVNGKLVTLRQELQNGDTVEVVTSPSQRPRKDWLEFVVSSKARGKIRHAIRGAENERSRELGREILERELRRAGLSLPRLLERGEILEVARAESKATVENLFSAVGYGKLPAQAVLRRLAPEAVPEEVKPPRRRLFGRPKPSATSGVKVSGLHDVLVRFGQCCVPLPGDDVVGFVTRGRGVTVHVKDCRKVFELDPNRKIEVEWDDRVDVPRKIKVRVLSHDKPGLLAQVTRTISQAGINIGGARVSTDEERRATQTFDLWVTDLESLSRVMKEIGRIRGVHSVERVRS